MSDAAVLTYALPEYLALAAEGIDVDFVNYANASGVPPSLQGFAHDARNRLVLWSLGVSLTPQSRGDAAIFAVDGNALTGTDTWSVDARDVADLHRVEGLLACALRGMLCWAWSQRATGGAS